MAGSKFGDLNGTTTIEFIAPAAVTALSWNGVIRNINRTTRGTLSATINGAGSVPTLPTLQNWKVMGRYIKSCYHRTLFLIIYSLPEVKPDFDDSSFVTADLTTTNVRNMLRNLPQALLTSSSTRICHHLPGLECSTLSNMGLQVNLSL